MNRSALLVGLLFVALALAGCSDDKGGGKASSTSTTSTTSASSTSSTTTSSHSTSSTSSSSSTTGAPTNHAPSGSLSASKASGAAPLAVNFTLSGSDSDGDTLAWDLAFGDGNTTHGTSLPATEPHSYAAAGNFTATFTLTDGKTPSTYTVAINVSSAGATPAGPQVVTGSVVGDPVSCAQWQLGVNDPWGTVPVPLEMAAWAKFDVASSTVGKPFLMDITPTAPAAGPFELQFYAADNAGTDYFDSADPMTFDIAGNVPDGSAFAVLYACTAGPADFTYTAGP